MHGDDAAPPLMVIRSAFTDLEEHRGDIVIREQSRFARLTRLRVYGNVIVEPFCSQFVLEDLYIVGGQLRVMGGCWQGRIASIFVDEAPDIGIHIGDGTGTVCTTLTLDRLCVRAAQSWGIHLTNQVALTAIGLAADGCGKGSRTGGLLLVSAHGSYLGLSCESNNEVGAKFYDCRASVSGPNWLDNPIPYVVEGRDKVRIV